MNSKNNGKMIIGILVMVVVAISIIGVTYAYFVATFNTNPNTESVRVTAGELIANYTHGQSLTVSNVVPGWVSDGIHYYDVDVAARNGGKIFASRGVVQADNTTVEPTAKALAKNGIAEPIAFSVTKSNRSSDDVSFIIRLNVEVNGIYNAWNGITPAQTILTSEAATTLTADNKLSSYNTAEELKDKKSNYNADRSRLYVALYEGEFDITAGPAANYGADALIGGPYVLADSGVQQILVTEPITISDDTEKKYFVMFKYENNQAAEQYAQNINITASANIIGVQVDNSNIAASNEDSEYTYTDATAAGGIITANDMIVPNVADTVAMSDTATDLTLEDGSSASIYYGTVTADSGSTAVNAAKDTKFAQFKTDYETMTVWYDADNKPVIWPVTTDVVSGAFTTDSSPVYSDVLTD